MPLSTIHDHRERARRRLPRYLFDYIEGGAHEEQTLQANVRDFRRVASADRRRAQPCTPEFIGLRIKPFPVRGMGQRQTFGRPENGVHAVQLKMCKALYMNERQPFNYLEDRATSFQPFLLGLLQAGTRAVRRLN